MDNMKPPIDCSGFHAATDANGRSEILAWDGRIDNRADLLWRTHNSGRCDIGDAALLLAAYDQWGVAGLVEVIGDWSTVIRDGSTGDVILASDFAGVRPLYYHWQPGKVMWSSRLRALVDATCIDTIDEQYVACF